MKKKKTKKCSVKGCKKLADTRGYCMAHYNRWRRYGSPVGAPVSTKRKKLIKEEVDEIKELLRRLANA